MTSINSSSATPGTAGLIVAAACKTSTTRLYRVLLGALLLLPCGCNSDQPTSSNDAAAEPIADAGTTDQEVVFASDSPYFNDHFESEPTATPDERRRELENLGTQFFEALRSGNLEAVLQTSIVRTDMERWLAQLESGTPEERESLAERIRSRVKELEVTIAESLQTTRSYFARASLDWSAAQISSVTVHGLRPNDDRGYGETCKGVDLTIRDPSTENYEFTLQLGPATHVPDGWRFTRVWSQPIRIQVERSE